MLSVTRLKIYVGNRRTSISLSTTLVYLLAARLDCELGTEEASETVRAWLQGELNAAADPDQTQISQWLQGRALLAVADPDLTARLIACSNAGGIVR